MTHLNKKMKNTLLTLTVLATLGSAQVFATTDEATQLLPTLNEALAGVVTADATTLQKQLDAVEKSVQGDEKLATTLENIRAAKGALATGSREEAKTQLTNALENAVTAQSRDNSDRDRELASLEKERDALQGGGGFDIFPGHGYPHDHHHLWLCVAMDAHGYDSQRYFGESFLKHVAIDRAMHQCEHFNQHCEVVSCRPHIH